MSRLKRSPILVPIDYSDASLTALRTAITMVDSADEITAVHASPHLKLVVPGEPELSGWSPEERHQSGLQWMTNWLESNSISDVRRAVLFGDPGLEVCRYAEDDGTNLIVLPSHGRHGWKRLFLGSVAERIIRHCECSVLVLKNMTDPGSATPFLPRKRVVVPIDCSDSSAMAVWSGLDLTGDSSDVDVINVIPRLDLAYNEIMITAADTAEELQTARQKYLERFLADRDLSFVNSETLMGDPGRTITQYATDNQADLIVVPSHGYHGVRRFLLGSVAERVVRHAECPVLVLRPWDAK